VRDHISLRSHLLPLPPTFHLNNTPYALGPGGGVASTACLLRDAPAVGGGLLLVLVIGLRLGMKTVRIFSDRIRHRIRLEGFRSVRIRVRIFNIRYRIRIRILKSYIYNVDIQSYLIRYD